jgi:hypothetical protein
MAPSVFTEESLDYVQEHLRILSGFYGIIKPLDGVVPYRLEMQAKLRIENVKDLYAYWGKRLAEYLFAETDCIVNLASKEYSQCIQKYLPPAARFITCVFGEEKEGKIIEKGTLCKMARGEMVRFLAEQAAQSPEILKAFDRMGCRLEGKAIAHKTDGNIISDGIVNGAIQVPTTGQPIIMLAERQATGGYTKIATVISVDLPVIGQCLPGDTLRFQAVSIDEAHRLLRAQKARFEDLERSLQAAPGRHTYQISINGKTYEVVAETI